MARSCKTICKLAVVLLTMSWAAAGNAKVTYQYFVALQNCGGGGGWLVMDHSPDGSVNIHVLCDGGAGGPLGP
jgi:hypothetical protein